MSLGELAAALTAAAAFVTALAGMAASLTLLVPILRHTRQTHSIVNGQRTDMEIYQAMLTDTLTRHGIPVPPNPAVRAPQAPPPGQG